MARFFSPSAARPRSGPISPRRLGALHAWRGRSRRAGLHEHERSREPYFDDLAELHARIRALFARPEERVFGSESGAAARTRFRTALDDLLGEDSRGAVLVVAHGTVISLAVAEANALDGFAFWERFGLGAHLVLATPDLALRQHVRLGAVR